MSFDTSRFTFNPWNDYSGVVMEQGRVQLDSDWNEWLAELLRRIQAGTLDILGQAVYPATTPHAFEITVTTDATGVVHVNIGPGRMYVDGLLAENHGALSTAAWDTALAELSGSPQPPSATPTGAIDYTQQPYLPGATLPEGSGPFLAYLDVWTRPVTYLEDSTLVDPAVNVDTTGRLQTVWQVKLGQVQGGVSCSSKPWPGPSAGQLTNGYAGTGASGPCCMTSGAGYTGLENQFYRVEIHNPGVAATANTVLQPGASATFKWSRDNASVETGVTAIQQVTNALGNNAAQLTVMSLGRDQVLGFAPGNWIEIIDDNLELNRQPGELHLIDGIDFASKTITLVNLLQTPANFPVDGSNQTKPSRHTRIRRWDQAGPVYAVGSTPGSTVLWTDLSAAGSTGAIPVPPPGTTLILENGITVAFGPDGTTQFNTGDFWNFAARTNTGQIDLLTNAPPRGIHHHYAPLGVVSLSPAGASDCRAKWPPAGGEGGCGCCTVTVGDGVNSHGDYTSVQAAINALTNGGEVCILPGRYFENVFLQGQRDVVIRGCGERSRVASAALKPGYQPPAQSSDSTTVDAVISIGSSQHIELRDFVVEAAPGETGILIDGTGELISSQQPNVPTNTNNADINEILSLYRLGDVDITVEKMVITASTMPAVLAKRVNLLKVSESRIAMANARSLYPAVWMSGEEIEFMHNRVGLQTVANLTQWIPVTVRQDLVTDAQSSNSNVNQISSFQTANAILNPGGIQIVGPSRDVSVAENEIIGGLRNGITLGGYTILDANGGYTKYTTGLTFEMETDCTQTGTLQSPTTFASLQGSSVVVSGLIEDVTIDRNRIENFGLCGIGPVGFFDLVKTFEVVAIDGLKITNNTIANTLIRAIASASVNTLSNAAASSLIGYGAICLPTVEDLVIRDNEITNFGMQPGVGVAGIFLLHGESVDISRNRITDNRDWADASQPDQTGNPAQTIGAVTLLIVTPPTLASAQTGLSALAVYEPGLPALRMEENVVRVPMGQALEVLGFGPFEISNNHFSCGGNIPGTATSKLRCVTIMNMSKSIELITASSPSQAYGVATTYSPAFNANAAAPFTSSSGAVLFTNNVCQLELCEVPESNFASVLIISLDHLNFSNNHCWLDASGQGLATTGQGMLVDALLMAGSLNVVSNRFQEAQNAVVLSAWTVGVLNVTSNNVSTFCIYPQGAVVAATNNLALINSLVPGICDALQKRQG